MSSYPHMGNILCDKRELFVQRFAGARRAEKELTCTAAHVVVHRLRKQGSPETLTLVSAYGIIIQPISNQTCPRGFLRPRIEPATGSRIAYPTVQLLS